MCLFYFWLFGLFESDDSILIFSVNVRQIMDPDNQVLIEGVLFRARYLGSTQLITDGNPTKLTRMLQAQEAVGRIKVCDFLIFVH